MLSEEFLFHDLDLPETEVRFTASVPIPTVDTKEILKMEKYLVRRDIIGRLELFFPVILAVAFFAGLILLGF